MDLGLDNQVAFVAGSSRGIGRAIAETLLDAGARVVVTGRDDEALRATGEALAARHAGRVLVIRADLTGREAIARAFGETVAAFGQLDHLIANVGTGSGMPGWDLPDDEWARAFELNFFASVRLAQAAIPHLLDRGGGSVLFIASIVAFEATNAPLPYSASKAALVNYAKNLARRLGPQRVRVNTIAPGNIFFEGGSWERHRANDRAGVDAMIAADVPLQRFGRPDEIASLAAYLCSPLAGFATGGCHVVDGGQTRAI